jgi:hypothetical protein
MAELRQRLPVGLTTNEIAAHLGPPDRIKEAEKGWAEWTYSLPPFLEGEAFPGTYVYGVTVTITNGHLARWDCSYARPPGTTVVHEEIYPNSSDQPPQATNQDAPLLKFFIVSTNPIAGGRLIDTKQFPKLGFISSNANLAIEIKSLTSVTFEEQTFGNPPNAVEKEWTLSFHLSETDAPRFESLTADNIDKSFLMMVANEPLFSATIREPISGGNFRLGSTNQALIEAAKKQLINVPHEHQ